MIFMETSAQDSIFIEQYKAFRAATDSFSTYTLQLKNDQNKRTIYLNSYKKIFENAYHFLRLKELKNKKPDCKILVAIKKVEILEPIERTIKNWDQWTYHEFNTKYHLTVHIEVYRKEELVSFFPLMVDSLLTKVYSYKLIHGTTNITDDFSSTSRKTSLGSARLSKLEDKAKIEPNLDDIKDHIIALMRLYKNYYIDQVDWKYSKQ